MRPKRGVLPKPLPPLPLRKRWMTIMQYALWAEKGDEVLGVIIQNTSAGWTIMALSYTTPKTPPRTMLDSVGHVLDSHAHEMLPRTYGTQLAAMRAAEAYARKWRGAKKPCTCGPIGKGKAA